MLSHRLSGGFFSYILQLLFRPKASLFVRRFWALDQLRPTLTPVLMGMIKNDFSCPMFLSFSFFEIQMRNYTHSIGVYFGIFLIFCIILSIFVVCSGSWSCQITLVFLPITHKLYVEMFLNCKNFEIQQEKKNF